MLPSNIYDYTFTINAMSFFDIAPSVLCIHITIYNLSIVSVLFCIYKLLIYYDLSVMLFDLNLSEMYFFNG